MLRRLRPHIGAALNSLAGIRKLGWPEWRRLRAAFPQHWHGGARELTFRAPPLLHPITIRAGTSDAGELVHTVLRAAYARHAPAAARVVIDAGANLGDSAAWYASRYPEARIIAIEPDPATFALLQRNVAPYGERVTALHAALWSVDAAMRLHDRDSFSGTSAKPAAADEPADCEAVTVDGLIERFGLERIDIFKCDIEGAEAEVFGQRHPWMDDVGCYFIDVHGPAALRAVTAALPGRRHFRHRELHIFLREQ